MAVKGHCTGRVKTTGRPTSPLESLLPAPPALGGTPCPLTTSEVGPAAGGLLGDSSFRSLLTLEAVLEGPRVVFSLPVEFPQVPTAEDLV